MIEPVNREDRYNAEYYLNLICNGIAGARQHGLKVGLYKCGANGEGVGIFVENTVYTEKFENNPDDKYIDGFGWSGVKICDKDEIE